MNGKLSFKKLEPGTKKNYQNKLDLWHECHAMPNYVYGCGPCCERNSQHSSLFGPHGRGYGPRLTLHYTSIQRGKRFGTEASSAGTIVKSLVESLLLNAALSAPSWHDSHRASSCRSLQVTTSSGLWAYRHLFLGLYLLAFATSRSFNSSRNRTLSLLSHPLFDKLLCFCQSNRNQALSITSFANL